MLSTKYSRQYLIYNNIQGTFMTVNKRPHPIVGFLLLLPASLACILNLVIPSVSLLLTSFQRSNPLRGDSQFIGTENYQAFFQSPATSEVLGFTGLVVLLLVAVIAIMPALFAIGAHETGRLGRTLIRIAISLPLAFYSPVALGLAAQTLLRQREILFDLPQVTVGVLLAFHFGIVAGALAIFAYLMATAATEEDKGLSKIMMPMGVVWMVGFFAAIAVALQAFILPEIVIGGAFQTNLLAGYGIDIGLIRFDLGEWAAISTLQLIPLYILGIVTVAVLVATDLCITTRSEQHNLFSNKGVGIGILVVAGLFIFGAIALWTVAGVVTAVGGRSPEVAELFTPVVVLNTLLPSLFRLFVFQLPLLVLTALAIGALRPLGRWSEALLLLFAPWTYVAGHTLAGAYIQRFIALDLMGTRFATLPPLAMSIPMLIVLTLFYKGRVKDWQASGRFMTNVLLPSLPLIGLFSLAMLVYTGQNYTWQFMMITNSDFFTSPMTAARLLFSALPDAGATAVAIRHITWLRGIVVFILLVLSHVFVLDQLALTRMRYGDEVAELAENMPLDVEA